MMRMDIVLTGLYGTEMETLSTQVCVATADE